MRKPARKAATPKEAVVDKPVRLRKRNRPEYASDAMADTLQGLGFRYAFLNPGASYRGLHDSIVNYLGNRDPQMVLCNHEDVCVHAAQGYAKASGEPALAILHDLVGLMHGTMGVFNAYCDRQPVVVLGGSGPQDPEKRRSIDYLHSANTQGELVRPFVKWDDEAVTPEAVCESIARGHKIANTGPKGPVYISIDAGVQETKLSGPIEIPDASLACNQAPPPPAANPAAVEQAAAMLVRARNPVISGQRIMHRREAAEPLKRLVELTGAAYVEDSNGNCLASNHPQNLSGIRGVLGKADVLLAVDSPDVTALVSGYSARMRGHLGGTGSGTKIIDLSQNEYVTRSWSRVTGKVAPTTLQLLADPVVGMEQLIDAVRSGLRRNSRARAAAQARRKRHASAHDAFMKKQQATLKARWDEVPISPHRFAHEVFQAVRRKPWLLTNRGHRAWPVGIWQFQGCGDYLGHSGGGGVGYGPGAMVGAALAARDQGRFPVGIMGDGDFQMSSGALWTAVHMKIPLLCIINNNTSWFNDEQHQVEVAKMRKRPVENAWIGTTTRVPDCDLATVAEGWGAWSEGPITDGDQLAAALKRAVKEVEGGAVAVLDVRNAYG
ncbi:MAG: thiamine pyrophosphate-binding protein [Alphaproteobacteria bacterium]|nr:thiamine pyrophosphate-binding protein [Alphaproteobacteria bacterium]